MDWTQSPELVATFRAEVDDRLASLRDGLMALEGNRSPRLAVEALMRWDSPRHGSVPPGIFIPLAERLGLIDRLALRHDLPGDLPKVAGGLATGVARHLRPIDRDHPRPDSGTDPHP